MVEKITIDDRKFLQLNGVKEVGAFSGSEVRLTLFDGAKMIIKGIDLKISAFSKESGAFSLQGSVGELKIQSGKDKFLRRIFK